MRLGTWFALAAVGCGSHDDPPVPTPPPEPPVAGLEMEGGGLRPAPGTDLDGPIAPPDRSGPVRRGTAGAAPLDLVADRAVVRVAVPAPPHGGSVGFTFDGDRPAWVARLPDAHQLPAVAYGDGRVYVSGGFESVTFYAMDATTGRIDWATTDLEDNGPTAAIFDDGRVVFNTESCTLFALDAKTGRRLWHRWLGDPTLAQTAVAGGLVFAAHPADAGHQLSAYRVRDGAPVWSRWVGSELLAGPVVSGDSVYASTVGGLTVRIARDSGRLIWRKPLHATTAPWLAGDELFVGRRTRGPGGVVEQQVVVDANTGQVIREHQRSRAAAGDVPADTGDWKSVWAFEGSRPVVDRGVRYVAMGSEVHATDATTGEPLWRRRYGDQARRVLGSVAIAGSLVVVAARDGKLFGLDVDTGFTVWSYDLGKRIVAEPVIARGWVYATTDDGFVVGLNVADPTLDGWHMFGGNPHHNGLVVTAPRRVEGRAAPIR